MPSEPGPGQFRLAIDRCFTLTGAGVVVTGTVFSGAVAVGDRLTLSPQGLPVRVRAIHAQNQQAQAGAAGERCAVNITGQRPEQGAGASRRLARRAGSACADAADRRPGPAARIGRTARCGTGRRCMSISAPSDVTGRVAVLEEAADRAGRGRPRPARARPADRRGPRRPPDPARSVGAAHDRRRRRDRPVLAAARPAHPEAPGHAARVGARAGGRSSRRRPRPVRRRASRSTGSRSPGISTTRRRRRSGAARIMVRVGKPDDPTGIAPGYWQATRRRGIGGAAAMA